MHALFVNCPPTQSANRLALAVPLASPHLAFLPACLPDARCSLPLLLTISTRLPPVPDDTTLARPQSGTIQQMRGVRSMSGHRPQAYLRVLGDLGGRRIGCVLGGKDGGQRRGRAGDICDREEEDPSVLRLTPPRWTTSRPWTHQQHRPVVAKDIGECHLKGQAGCSGGVRVHRLEQRSPRSYPPDPGRPPHRANPDIWSWTGGSVGLTRSPEVL